MEKVCPSKGEQQSKGHICKKDWREWPRIDVKSGTADNIENL
jgi:hypothetical protein